MATVQNLFDPGPYYAGDYQVLPEAEQRLDERLGDVRDGVLTSARRAARLEGAGIVTITHVDSSLRDALQPNRSSDLVAAVGGIIAGAGLSVAWALLDGGQHSVGATAAGVTMLPFGTGLMAFSIGRRSRGGSPNRRRRR